MDANFTQDSQRSFFDSAHRRVFATVDDFRDDVLSCVTQGSVLGVGFDVVFAGGFTTSVIDRYVQVINRLRSLYGLIVVDMDRFGAQDVSNRLTVAGGLLVPCLLRGDRLLFVSRVGMQSSRDSVNSLRELLSVYGLSHGLVAVVDAVPYPVKVARVDWSKVAVYAGEQPWSTRVEEFISRASLGWSDENLDTSRNRIMRWLFPDMKIGEDNHSKSKKKKKRSRQSKVRSHRA